MKTAILVRCSALIVAFACICVSAAQADVDSKLVGYWLFKTTPVSNWTVWHIAANGTTHTQLIGGDDTRLVLESHGSVIKKVGSTDDKDDMLFAMKGDDQVVLSANGSLGMMVRISEEHWKAMVEAGSAESFSEYSDPRFALLGDKKQVFSMLANVDPAMVGTWVLAGPDNSRSIWRLKENGAVEVSAFLTDGGAPPVVDLFWSIRHGDKISLVSDNSAASAASNVKYKFLTPNEMIWSGSGSLAVLMKVPDERESELSKLPPAELSKAPELIKLADEYTKVAGSSASPK
jgi:hypothetical protein